MNIIQIAQKHYENQGTRSLTIPEWLEGSTPFEIFFKPFTAADYEKIDKLAGKNPSAARQDVCTLIVKSLNKDGNRIFKSHDVDELMMVDKMPIYKAVLEMVTAQNKINEEVEKN